MRPPVIITVEVFTDCTDIAAIRAAILDRLTERPLDAVEHVVVT